MSLISLPQIWLVYVAFLGAAIGSFLNVVICRLPYGQSVVSPRSACPTCHTTLQNRDNIPLLGFVLLRGRCRTCKTQISPRYFLVELLTMGLFLATAVRFGPSSAVAMWFVLDALLVAIIFLDIDHWWIPDVLSFPAMAVALVGSVLPEGMGIARSLIGLTPALVLWGISAGYGAVTKKEAMGFGDIKLMAVMGLALGMRDGFTALSLASFEGAVLGGLVLFFGGHQGVVPPSEAAEILEAASPVSTLEDEAEEAPWEPPPGAIPFGPFLALGTFQVMLLPEVFGKLPMRLVESCVVWLAP